MRSVRLSLALCSGFLPFFPMNAVAQAAPVPALDLKSRLALLESAMEAKRADANAPGCGLVIIKDDQIIYMKGLGYKDLATKQPITPETMFAIGSSSKAFTALTVMMTRDDGKLALTDSPRKFLPYFSLQDPDANAKITINDLLCHRSGLDRTDLAWYAGNFSRKEIIQYAGTCKPTAKLGEKFQYQNVMFLTAGEIVGSAQHTSWDNFVKKRVFAPLGMKSTTLAFDGLTQAADHATGYETYGTPAVTHVKPFHRIECIAPAGAINSNLRDMAQWVRFMLNTGTVNGKRLVSEASFNELISPHMTLVPKIDYGYGWFLRDWHGHKVVEHGGNIDGFTTAVAFMPDQHLGFVMLCNQNNSAFPPSALEVVWKSLVDLPPTDKTTDKTANNSAGKVTPTVKPEDETGDYTYENKFNLAITVKEGKLTATTAGQPPYPLIPVGGRKYKLGDPAPDGFFLTFHPNEKDANQREVLLEQPGVKLPLKKKSVISANEAAYKAPLTVEELEAKVVEALGGETALRKHTASILRVTGKQETQGLTGKGTIYIQAPNLSCNQTDYFILNKRAFGTREWCDGKAAATELKLTPTILQTGKGLVDHLVAADFYEPLDWKTLYKTVTIKSEDKVNGESVYVVEKTPENGDTITDFISTKTFLTLRRDTVEVSAMTGAGQPVSEFYSDYRRDDGVSVAFHRLLKSVGGEITMMVEKIEWNPKLNPAVFRAKK